MHSAGDIIHLGLKVLLVLGLIAVNGFFVAAEFALVKIRATQLDTLVARGHRRAKVARSIIANLNSFLSATQLGITMTSLGLGWVGQPVFTSLLSPVLASLQVESAALRHSISFLVGFSALTFLHISAGELAPKRAAGAAMGLVYAIVARLTLREAVRRRTGAGGEGGGRRGPWRTRQPGP